MKKLIALTALLAAGAVSASPRALECKIEGSPWSRYFKLDAEQKRAFLGAAPKQVEFNDDTAVVTAVENDSYSEVYHINRADLTIQLVIKVLNQGPRVQTGTCVINDAPPSL